MSSRSERRSDQSIARQGDFCVIADNLSAHKTKRVDEFLMAHANVHLHLTPTYSSWLNQVELWFAKNERDVITRGVFTSVANLKRKLLRDIRQHNKQAKPVKWKYFDPSRRITPDSIVTVSSRLRCMARRTASSSIIIPGVPPYRPGQQSAFGRFAGCSPGSAWKAPLGLQPSTRRLAPFRVRGTAMASPQLKSPIPYCPLLRRHRPQRAS
jgi:hypothetical protein